MNHFRRNALIFALLAACVVRADDQPKSATIIVPEVDQLQWSNLRLDAQARRSQAETLRMQADQLDAKANDKLAEIKTRLGGAEAERYDFELTKDGKMQLVRRPDPKKETAK